MRKKLLIWSWLAAGEFLLAFLSASLGIAQEGTEVKVSTSVVAERVPLNRTTKVVVQLKWKGTLSDIEFDQPDTPTLSNFKLAGSASSNWAGIEDGVNTAVRTFEYTVRPEGLGMGYVEGMRLSYLDKATGEKHSLYTDRLGIEVIDPVREPGEAPLGMAMTLGLVVTIVAAALVFLFESRSKKRERERRAAEAEKPLELEYLDRLRSTIDVNTIETKPAFTELSRLLRQYLRARFEIPTQGISTAEVVAAYGEIDDDVDQTMRLQEILQASDVAKFSGESGDPAKLARAYALTELFLQTNLKAQEPSTAATS